MDDKDMGEWIVVSMPPSIRILLVSWALDCYFAPPLPGLVDRERMAGLYRSLAYRVELVVVTRAVLVTLAELAALFGYARDTGRLWAGVDAPKMADLCEKAVTILCWLRPAVEADPVLARQCANTRNVMDAHKAGKTIRRGTAIATFENGRYPQRCQAGYTGSCHHAALVLTVQPGGIWIMDQYNTDEKRMFVDARFLRIPMPRERKLPNGRWKNAGNNPLAFYVISK